MIGLKTTGHATLIAFDGGPLLATDPWLGGAGAYFGSWQLPYPIPPQELSELRTCRYLWISHGHPDHLCLESLETLRQACILLPDHVGGRIFHDLHARGYTVQVLPDRQWIPLSRRVRVCCIADYMQNAVLLVDVDGRLFLNLNDASDRGWREAVRSVVREFKQSYLLKLAPTGNLGILNVFDEQGHRLLGDHSVSGRAGAQLAVHADWYGVTHVIPFSSFHICQRTDSAWANEYVAPLEAYAHSFASMSGATLLPPFVEIDCERDTVRETTPPKNEVRLIQPEEFGDNWGDRLERDDVAAITQYFCQKESLRDRVGLITLRVGGEDHRVVLNRALKPGITFEAPRNSLMAAVKFEVFDDLLLGHFMKITLQGMESLVPDFVPVVTRFADNGRVQTKAEVEEYLAAYRRRATVPILWDALREDSEGRVRWFAPDSSMQFNLGKRGYIRHNEVE